MYYLPFFLITAAILAFSALLAKQWKFFATNLKEEPHGRYESLDGLRGILAFGVFFQHAVTNWAYYKTGVWQITDEKFYRFLGGESVILFFMITSFLYWSKAIANKGELNAYSIYKNRIYRLAPMYLFTAAIVVFFALCETGFIIPSITQLIRDVFSWLSLGIITTTSVNGLSIIPINAGIHWTLHFEWILYIALPFIAITLRNKAMHLLAIPVLAIVALAPDKGYWMIFLFGILAAHTLKVLPKQTWAAKSSATLIPLIGLVLVYMIDYKPYGVLQYCITFFIFLFFLYGNTIWGLLKSPAAKLLGTMSYSIYLIHGIVLYIVLKGVNLITPVAAMSAFAFWSLMLACALVIVIISGLTYRYIEYPFLKKYRAKLTDKVM